MRRAIVLLVLIKDPITTSEAAEILDRDPSGIRHMIRDGKLVAEKRGRDNYVSRRAILKIKAKRLNSEDGASKSK